MAMSLKGNTHHYLWNDIQLRHWYDMAKLCRFPEGSMSHIINDVFERMENVIDDVRTMLPKNFPDHISQPIFQHMLALKKLLKN